MFSWTKLPSRASLGAPDVVVCITSLVRVESARALQSATGRGNERVQTQVDNIWKYAFTTNSRRLQTKLATKYAWCTEKERRSGSNKDATILLSMDPRRGDVERTWGTSYKNKVKQQFRPGAPKRGSCHCRQIVTRKSARAQQQRPDASWSQRASEHQRTFGLLAERARSVHFETGTQINKQDRCLLNAFRLLLACSVNLLHGSAVQDWEQDLLEQSRLLRATLPAHPLMVSCCLHRIPFSHRLYVLNVLPSRAL